MKFFIFLNDGIILFVVVWLNICFTGIPNSLKQNYENSRYKRAIMKMYQKINGGGVMIGLGRGRFLGSIVKVQAIATR
jgi:hypothetical protein